MSQGLTSSLIVRLVDQVTGPAKKVASSLTGLNRAAGGNFGTRLQGAIERNNVAIDRMRGRMFDAVGGFYLFKGAIGVPLKAAAGFETALEDIGQKAGIPQERLAALGAQIRQIAGETNQSSMQIASAVDNLVGKGAAEDVALAASGPIGKAATAYRAATDDLAAAAWSAVDNLKVPSDQIGTAIDMMAQAGKEGAFELRDMAQYFPALGAQYQALGQSGTGAVADIAAALQIVRKGTGDASGAATNLQNVLQKIYSNRTIKGFKDLGVDIREEMTRAAEAGQTPIEAIAEITNKALGGDLSRLGEVFEDAQVQAGMRSLIQNMEEYRRIRQEALGAQGVVDEDFARRIETAQGAMDRWSAALENLGISIGTTLVPLLTNVLDKIIPIVDAVGKWAQANPELARGIFAAAAALVAFKIATATLSFVGLMGKGGALSILSLGFNSVGKSAIGASRAAKGAVALQTALGAMSGLKMGPIETIVTALKGMAMAFPGVAGVGSALSAVGAALATISLPVWGGIALAAAAIGGAGFLIWKYWDRLSSIFSGVARAIGEQLSPAIEAIKEKFGQFREWMSNWVGNLAESMGADGAAAQAAFDAVFDFSALTQKFVDFKNWLGSFFQQEVLGDEQKAAFEQAGYDVATRMINSIKTKIGELVEWFRGLPKMILDAIGPIDIGQAINNTFGWGGAPAANQTTAPANYDAGTSGLPVPSGHRANGGNVWPGGSFIVNEKEQEIFTPKKAGTVTPASQAGGNSSSVGDVTIIIQDARDPQATAREVRNEMANLMRGAHADQSAWSA